MIGVDIALGIWGALVGLAALGFALLCLMRE